MLPSLTNFATLTLLISLTLPVESLAAADANSTSPSFFPANLAARLSSVIKPLRRSLTFHDKPRTVNDEIKELLRVAKKAAASSSSHSHSASATATAVASHHLHSASASASSKARKRDLEEAHKAIREADWEVLDSTLLCPGGATACPMNEAVLTQGPASLFFVGLSFPRMGSYECIDTLSELESCGGCASRNEGEDCTQIKGAQGVTCNSGRCQVYSCQTGWKLERDGKGRDRCRKLRKETV
ncbi:priA protein precursor [Pseudohyphozyma bogoriensis]|nr:priA protein precursor [Pseudohyphozyma bogoriensis]